MHSPCAQFEPLIPVFTGFVVTFTVQLKLLFRKLTPTTEILQWAYAVTLPCTSLVTVTSNNKIKTNYPHASTSAKISHPFPVFIHTQKYLAIYLC